MASDPIPIGAVHLGATALTYGLTPGAGPHTWTVCRKRSGVAWHETERTVRGSLETAAAQIACDLIARFGGRFVPAGIAHDECERLLAPRVGAA